MQFLSFGCLPLLLPLLLLLLLLFLLAFFSLARSTGAGSTVAGLSRSRLRPLALVIWQVGNSLREGQQDLALDRPSLRPGAARPAAELPGTGDEAGEERRKLC